MTALLLLADDHIESAGLLARKIGGIKAIVDTEGASRFVAVEDDIERLEGLG